MKNTIYYNQAELLLRILPLIYRQREFALKGGTAINFFFRNLPRLSVDIDLVYLPIEDRATTLQNISNLLINLQNDILRTLPDSQVYQRKSGDEVFKLTVKFHNAIVKIEPNLIIRGSVFPPIDKEITKVTQIMFNNFVKCQTLSMGDLYGGKICAALDRQHPRDLFDIKLLLEDEGITDDIKYAFIVYLISHPRPMVELLNPNFKNIKEIFIKEFKGMSRIPVDLFELIEVRKNLIDTLNGLLTDQDKNFLLSVKSGIPDWSKFPLSLVQNLPSVKWKLININKMNKNKHQIAYNKLKKHLF